jgi:RHS repeat-associated protein
MIRFCAAVFMVVGFLVCPTNAAAQSYTFGIPPFSSVDGGPDSINLSNLGINYGVPIFSRAGRGAPLSLAASIQSFNWSQGLDINNGAMQWALTLAPPSIGSPVGSVLESVASKTCGPRGAQQNYNEWTFSGYFDANGTLHPFRLVVNDVSAADCNYPKPMPTASGIASDDSGVTLSVTNAPSAVVTLRDGTVINPPLATLKGWGAYTYWTFTSGSFTSIDSNGNKLTAVESGGYVTSVTDTLGNVAVTGPGNPSSLSYTAPSGAPASVTFSTTRLTVQSAWNCPNVEEFTATPFDMVTKITLPDGSYYQIAYEATSLGSSNITGRIASVRLPTGATIFYTYTGGDTGKGIICADGSVAGFNRTTPDGMWKYLRSNIVLNYGTVASSTTTVTDPQGNATVINFGGNYETQRQVYSGAATGTPLETIVTCYNGNTSGCATAQNIPTPSEITSFRSFNGGSQSEVDTLYNGYGLMTSKNEYDFGAATPTRKTTITYDSTIGYPVIDRPSVVSVTDGSGNLQSQTTYTYDQDEVAGTLQVSGASQLAAVTCTASSGKCRGNPTSIASYVNSGATLTKIFVHYDTGQVYKATDVNGATTQYTYGNCGNSLLSKVSLPLSLSQSSTWNCTGGVMTSSTDANGNTSYTNYTTDPFFWRPESTKDPLGNLTTYSYPNPTTFESVMNFGSTSTSDILVTTDGLGRQILRQVREKPGSSLFDSTQTSYGWANGHAFTTVSMPYVGTAGQAASGGTGVTTTQVDPLGRLYQQATTGNATITHTYSNNSDLAVLSPPPSGENNKQTLTFYDGLGRVSSVCHIGSTTSTGSTTPCAAGSSYNGAVDVYAYSQASGSTIVSVTRGSQTRTQTFDGLGRLIQKVTPEGGRWNYDYDASTCAGAVAAKGSLVCTRDSGGNQTTYQYDTLSRPTHIGNPSYCKNFGYDNTAGILGTLPAGVTLTNQYGQLVEAETDDCNPSLGASHLYSDEWFAYDNDGNALNQWQWSMHSTQYYKSTATFYANGAVNTLQLASPSLYTMTWGVDGEGRMSALTDTTHGQGFATGASYYPAANPATVSLTGGNLDSFTFDTNTGKLGKYAYTVASNTLNGTLQWNANGTLHQLYTQDGLTSVTQTCNDAYDDWARLISFDCGSGNWGQTYSYDIYDNLGKSVISGRTGTTWLPGYNASNNHCNICTYDGYGDVIYDGTSNYGFDAYEKLFSTGATSYQACSLSGSGRCILYDAFGRMVEYSNNGSWAEVWYTQAGTATMSGASIQWGKFPAPMGAAALIQGNVTGYFYLHPDWLGSSRLISSPNNKNSWLSDASFAPYGETIAVYGTNTPWNAFAGTSEEFDPGVLWDTPNRELNANQGRWLSPDPAGSGWNQYAYPTNPHLQVDPSGLEFNDVQGFFLTELDASNQNVDFSFNSFVDSGTRWAAGENYYNLPGKANAVQQGLDSYNNAVAANGYQQGLQTYNNALVKFAFPITGSYTTDDGLFVYTTTPQLVDKPSQSDLSPQLLLRLQKDLPEPNWISRPARGNFKFIGSVYDGNNITHVYSLDCPAGTSFSCTGLGYPKHFETGTIAPFLILYGSYIEHTNPRAKQCTDFFRKYSATPETCE